MQGSRKNELGLISYRVDRESSDKRLIESDNGQYKESGVEAENNNNNTINNTIASLAAKLNIDSRTADGHIKNNVDALTKFSNKSFFKQQNTNDNLSESYL